MFIENLKSKEKDNVDIRIFSNDVLRRKFQVKVNQTVVIGQHIKNNISSKCLINSVNESFL